MGEYTYLVGLLIMGAVVFAIAMAGIERERRAHRRDDDAPAH